MNDSIEKLFDQALAEFRVENKFATIVSPDPLQRDFVEKFAQLIVKECADVARGWTDVYVVEDNAPRQIDEFIKKEFGVEE